MAIKESQGKHKTFSIQRIDKLCRRTLPISKEELHHLIRNMPLLIHLILSRCRLSIIQEETWISLITIENIRITHQENFNMLEERRLIITAPWS